MKDLTAMDVESADDLPREVVDVPEWGGRVYISVLDGNGLDMYQSSLLSDEVDEAGYKKTDVHRLHSKLVTACCVDNDGNRIFSSIDSAAKKNGKVLARLYNVAVRLNATTDEAVEQRAKNS
jgi:hypothetical protein